MSAAPQPVADLSYPPDPQRWPPAFPPVGASAWGDDQYGLWIEVGIGGPVQPVPASVAEATAPAPTAPESAAACFLSF